VRFQICLRFNTLNCKISSFNCKILMINHF
jgi:hypothetical protein